MRALILIDIQHDFLPGGALAVKEGDRVIPIANQVQPLFEQVILTQDWHPEDHGSFAENNPGTTIGEVIELNGLPQVMWPVHCLKGEEGAEFPDTLDTENVSAVFRKGVDPTIDSYSGFFDNDRRRATGLGDYLQKKGVEQVYLMGLATDYCVKFSALDAVSLGFETYLIVDGCRGVELAEGDIEAAMAEMKTAGVKISKSGELFQ